MIVGLWILCSLNAQLTNDAICTTVKPQTLR